MLGQLAWARVPVLPLWKGIAGLVIVMPGLNQINPVGRALAAKQVSENNPKKSIFGIRSGVSPVHTENKTSSMTRRDHSDNDY